MGSSEIPPARDLAGCIVWPGLLAACVVVLALLVVAVVRLVEAIA